MKDLLCFWSFRINIMKTAISKNDLESLWNLHQNPKNIFLETKVILKLMCGTDCGKQWEKTKQCCKYPKLDFKWHHWATVIKTTGGWQNNTHADDWGRTEGPEISHTGTATWVFTKMPETETGRECFIAPGRTGYPQVGDATGSPPLTYIDPINQRSKQQTYNSETLN